MGTSEGASKGWTEERRARQRETRRRIEADPEYRAKLSKAVKKSWDQNPDRKVSQGAKVSAANTTDPVQRFAESWQEDADGCHVWTRTKILGYAKFHLPGGKKMTTAIRWLWNELHGPPPEGLQPDHLCHTYDLDCPGGECKHRACVNLEHIEWVTPSENLKRMHRRKKQIKERQVMPI